MLLPFTMGSKKFHEKYVIEHVEEVIALCAGLIATTRRAIRFNQATIQLESISGIRQRSWTGLVGSPTLASNTFCFMILKLNFVKLAIKNRHEGAMRLLLTKDGVDISVRDKVGRTPLLQVAEEGHEGIAKLLQTKSIQDHERGRPAIMIFSV